MIDERSLAKILDAVPDPLPPGQRFVIAVAGPPTAGKSTLAQELQQALAPSAAVLGLDAFHFDDDILAARGDRPRKGAPHTFDVGGYRRTLTELRAKPSATIAVPRFDRSLELSRNAADLVTAEHQIVITEGNYLLLDDRPWNELRPLFDLTVSLTVALTTVEQRVLSRWAQHGLNAAEAQVRYETNDGPNADLVLARSSSADVHLTND